MDWFALKSIQMIYCCDANFGVLKRDIELVKYIAKVKKNIGFPTYTVAEAEMRLQDAFVTIHEQDMAAFEKDMNASLAVSA